MKKLLVMILILALVLASGCAGAAKSLDVTLAEKGLEMTRHMDELASSEAYVAAMSAAAELSEIISTIGAADHTAPDEIYLITFPEGSLQAVIGSGNLGLPKELSSWIEYRAYTAIPAQLAAFSGATTLAAVSCISYNDSFLCRELTTPTLMLYRFSGEYSVIATFRPGQDGTVSEAALFVPNAGIFADAKTADDISELLTKLMGVSKINVTTVTLP